MSRENFFIPPFIKGRESIPSLEEYVSKVEKDIDFSPVYKAGIEYHPSDVLYIRTVHIPFISS